MKSWIFGLSLLTLISESHMATLYTRNNCPFTVWPGTLTGAGIPQLSNTGFELAPQAWNAITVIAPWSGRLWARTQCSTSSGLFTCATANCGSGQVACNGVGAVPPATLVEFTLAPNGGQDFYDISLVDGFNLPISVTPQGGSGPNCTITSCSANVNAICPPELIVKVSCGNAIACKSACLAFNQPKYCCSGEYNSPQKCEPTNYSMVFKNQCPQAYSYAYDDKTSIFTCSGAPNYLITFCP
ncbi:hypothetical protein E1A91_D04G127300v1 [Gossypium mustelinum]|uniref:Thaumatin-like protein n=1 Tax=Gossypium mustelinum TaxID=34275 RepID=A0A5D2VD76_GOSMU|nr:hypothetical protein E1A91_D04G127300v1 [Gossypium mustelinum]